MSTKIKSCDCKHDYQDTRYGNGKRVMNKMKTGKGDEKHRCTVCGKVHGN